MSERIDVIAGLTAEAAARVESVIRERLFVMRDAMNGLPGAASYEGDRTSGHTTVVDERGIPMPSVADPTGEAAIRPDQAREDRRQLERHILAAYKALDAATSILSRYQPRSATERERAETAKQNETKPGCIICAQTEVAPGVKRFEYVTANQRCRWHNDFLRGEGRDATPQETDQHARGIKIRRPA